MGLLSVQCCFRTLLPFVFGRSQLVFHEHIIIMFRSVDSGVKNKSSPRISSRGRVSVSIQWRFCEVLDTAVWDRSRSRWKTERTVLILLASRGRLRL